MNGGIDERRRQKKAGHGDTDTRSHVPILQSIRLSGKICAEPVHDPSKNGGSETSSVHNAVQPWS
jgi:hypothetical protein